MIEQSIVFHNVAVQNMYNVSQCQYFEMSVSVCIFNAVKKQSGIGFIVDALFGNFANLHSLYTAGRYYLILLCIDKFWKAPTFTSYLLNYIHTYTHNWPLQPFSQDYGLASHATHVKCVYFIGKWRDFFTAGLFTFRVFARNLLRRNCRRNIFFFIFDD